MLCCGCCSVLSTPTRLAFGGILRSSAVLRVVPSAAASARLIARPIASSFGRLVGFASLRALSTVATPIASAAITSVDAVVASLNAAEMRTLDKNGVMAFVESLGVSKVQAKKLAAQDVDGAALLETSVDELRSYGLSGGAAHTIVRVITEVQTVTLTIYPPKSKGPSNTFTVKLTPKLFLVMFNPHSAPLRVANLSGSTLSVAASLAEAVEANRQGLILMASRRYDEDLATLNGFQANCATAFEIKSTHALATDTHLLGLYGPLELVNSGEEVELRLSRRGEVRLVVKPDGLVVSSSASVVLFNSAKLTPSVNHIDELLCDVEKLQLLFGDWANVTTIPPSAKSRLRWDLRIVPFLSGDNFSAAVEAKCVEKGVGIVRPSGEGFLVKAASGGL